MTESAGVGEPLAGEGENLFPSLSISLRLSFSILTRRKGWSQWDLRSSIPPMGRERRLNFVRTSPWFGEVPSVPSSFSLIYFPLLISLYEIRSFSSYARRTASSERRTRRVDAEEKADPSLPVLSGSWTTSWPSDEFIGVCRQSLRKRLDEDLPFKCSQERREREGRDAFLTSLLSSSVPSLPMTQERTFLRFTLLPPWLGLRLRLRETDEGLDPRQGSDSTPLEHFSPFLSSASIAISHARLCRRSFEPAFGDRNPNRICVLDLL